MVLLLLALVWLLQLGEVLTFRQGFLYNLAVLALLACSLPARRESDRPLLTNAGEGALLLVILACGVVTRTIGLDHFPPVDGQLWEETQTGKVAYDALRFGSLDPYFPLTNLTAEIGFRLFGISMTALRVPFVALGVLSVPLFFVAARYFLRTSPAALVVTAFFATSAYLSSASRVALETMAPIFTVTVALALTFRACAHRSASAFALAGLANGLLMLEYFSYKLLPPLIALFVIGYLLQEGSLPFCNRPSGTYRFSRLSAYKGRVLIFGLFALAVAVPLVLFNPMHPLEFFLEGVYRQQVGIGEASAGISLIGKLKMAGERVLDSVSFLFLRGGQNDIVPFFRGVIELPTGLLGVAALAYCAVRARRCPGKLFLVATIVLFVVLSGALVGNPARYRLTPLVPLYFLTLGVAVDDLMDWIRRRKRGLMTVAFATVVLCAVSLRSLAVDVLEHPRTQAEFYDLPLLVVSEVARLQRKDPEAEVYLVSNFDYLGGASDYEFLYDPERVTVVESVSQLAGKSGYVIGHGLYSRGIAKFSGSSDCRAWRTKVYHERLVVCRLNRTASD